MTVIADRFGHCVKCHRNLIYEQIIGDKPVSRFDTDYSEAEYLLDDGSKMRVAICKPCKETLSEEDNVSIMDCIKAGWTEEVEKLNWTAEKKQVHLDRYSKLEIISRSEGMPIDIIENKLTEYKESKNGDSLKNIHVLGGSDSTSERTQ